MKINQIATVLNTVINQEQIGESAVIQEDLTNIVDVGTAVLNYTGDSNTNYDSFMGKLIDQIGKQLFVDRVYTSQAPNIIKDSWEYGSILQKVRCELPDAKDNTSWNLADYPITGGAAYPDPFEITKPDVDAKFFNSKTTFEVPITFTQYQLKTAFTSAEAMSSFFSMVENRIKMKMTLSTDALVMRTIINLIGMKIGASNNVVNLLTLYNTEAGTALTAAQAKATPDFLRYSAKTMLLYKKYIQAASMLYNDGGYVTFTPEERTKFVLVSSFAKSLETNLYSDTYHNEFVKLDGYDEVGYWQGTGTSDAEREKINVKVDVNGTLTEVEQDGVVGVLFDEWAAVVCNQNYRVTSIYNPRGEYTNYFYKWDAMYMNDSNENCIVFVVASSEEASGEE